VFDFDPEALRAALAGAPLVSRIEIDRDVASTMDTARLLLRAGAGEGLLVLARTQARGRGRAAHVWASPPGGLYASLALAPHPGPEPLAVTLVVALAVKEALCGAGVSARLKWPNDLFVGRRKIAGVLGEAAEGAIVLGIGVNVNIEAGAFPPELRPIATSILLETGRPHDLGAFARALFEALEPRRRRWLAGDRSLFREAEAALILDHPVRWRAPSGMLYEGRPLGIAGCGELVIETGSGPVRAQAGDLEVLWTS
jgi:BirA family biotin operon repressor/biotin-[acetyl-CoA-carboxylase] ligase